VRDTVHGTALALGKTGVLIRGPSGAGKSDLALRCLALSANALSPQRFELIADDRVEVWLEGDAVLLACPLATAGKLEVRGVGIVDIAHVATPVVAGLVVDLVASPGMVERLPEPDYCSLVGTRLPRAFLYPFEPSAPFKLLLAVKIAAGAVVPARN
jgi:HPr kinase/phosphorylase